MKGLIITQQGDKKLFDYTPQDIQDRFNKFVENRGVGMIECFHAIEKENGDFYLFYGWRCGYNNFNKFDFPTTNVYGDVFVICKTEDLDLEKFEELFEVEDLFDTIIEDELRFQEEMQLDEYDYEDSFIER